MKSNDQLSSLVSLEKSAAATTALAYVGATVVVDGATAQLTAGTANWSLNVTKPSTATVTIKDSTGQNAFTGTVAVNPGAPSFTWNGRNDGRIWPDGSYTLTATAVDANNQSVGISTEVQATWIQSTSRKTRLNSRSTDRTYTLDKINASFGLPRSGKNGGNPLTGGFAG
jgi:flagellar basal-body rod modification protein FlgD